MKGPPTVRRRRTSRNARPVRPHWTCADPISELAWLAGLAYLFVEVDSRAAFTMLAVKAAQHLTQLTPWPIKQRRQ
jgi:hypothetical protein